ncbi:hypothetical protein TrST_g6149 [Triparma strigata]|uniref:Peptidase M11 gametolysin domain-containing protein n=1 Tax=Triparma strigata TaxID=1606541 RepID=A0A9W7BCI0_9STRA|nr:hypothetical protein TrST_g6149 [Triparma strigata]
MQHLAHILLFLLAALTGLNLFPFSTASPPTTMAFNPLSTQISGRALRSGLDFWDHEFVVAPDTFSAVFVSVSFTSGEDANNDCDIECLELKILEAKEQYNVSSWGRQEMVWSGEVYEITLQDMYDTYTWNPAYCDIVNTYSPLIELQGDVANELNLNHDISTDGDHDILVIFLPTAFGQDECRWDGMALVRGEVNQWSSTTTDFDPVWVRVYSDSPVVGHEMGHTMGLAHAGIDSNNNGECDSYSAITCEYGDFTSMMGNPSAVRSLSLPHRVMLGMLNMDDGDERFTHEVIIDSNTTVTFQLANLNVESLDDVEDGTFLGLYLEAFNDDWQFDGAYSISFMAADGWMDDSSYPRLGDRVMVHYVKKTDGGAVPFTPEFNVIKVVKTGGEGILFSDDDWIIEVLQISNNTANVSITFECPLCERAPDDLVEKIKNFDFVKWFGDNKSILIPSLAIFGSVCLVILACMFCSYRRNSTASRRRPSSRKIVRGSSVECPATVVDFNDAEAEPSAPPYPDVEVSY